MKKTSTLTTAKENLAAFLNPGKTPEREPQAPPPPPPQGQRIAPLHRMQIAVLKSAGLPDEKTRATLDALGKAFEAALEKMNGYSHDDARREFKNLVRAALDGEHDIHQHRHVRSEDLIARNALHRRVCRHTASLASRKGCLLAADVWEQALAHFPKFRETLLAQESAIYQGVEVKGSPLQRLCDDLQKNIKVQISRLRTNEAPMVNPRNLLT